MSIKILQDIFDKKGSEFISNLLNLDCRVSEKISSSKFSFEYNGEKLLFFKRDTTNPISKIDRILSKYYDDAIEYIETFTPDTLSGIKPNYRFHFQYFPDNTNIQSYNVIPKNKLVLTHILVKRDDKDLKSEEYVISSKDELYSWADKFGVGYPPIIFEGRLSDKQKDSLMEYIRMSKEDILKKFKTDSFSKFLIGILNPALKPELIDPNSDYKMEGVVFSFGDKNYQVLAKMIDPYFEQMSKTTNVPTEKNDIVSIIFSDIIEFMEQDDRWRKMKLYKIGVNDRYIELISRVYNNFIDNFGHKYETLDLNLPSYLKQPKFDLNLDLIENKKTLLFVNKSVSWKEIYKMFISLFRKKRNKTKEFLSPSIAKYQNNIVDQIYKKITSIDEGNFEEIYETYIEEFSLNDTLNTSNYAIPDIPERLIQKDELILENEESLDSMRIVSFWKRALESNTEEQKVVSGKGVNVVIGKFQPFNNGHMESCKKIYESNKKPIMIFQVHNGVNGESRPFSKDLSEKMLTKIVEDNKMFVGYHIIKNSSQQLINEKLDGKYYPITLAGNENFIRFFKKNQQLNENDDKKIEFIEFKKYINNDKHILNKNIVENIKNDDYLSFKKHTPQCIHGYFSSMKNELNNLK